MTRNLRTRFSTLALGAVLVLSTGALAACGDDDTDDATAPDTSADTAAHHSGAEAGLQATMRTLWGQHMEWTWSTVIAFVEESPGLDAQLERLLQNQQDIGDAIAGFYGDEAGAELADLLTIHIQQAVPVLTAAKNGDDAALGTALDDWYGNAQDIADFLSAANPDNWAQDGVRDMMKHHIDTTVGYATAALTGDYVAAVAEYDAAEEHMLLMGDVLAEGIVAQFPDQF